MTAVVNLISIARRSQTAATGHPLACLHPVRHSALPKDVLPSDLSAVALSEGRSHSGCDASEISSCAKPTKDHPTSSLCSAKDGRSEGAESSGGQVVRITPGIFVKWSGRR